DRDGNEYVGRLSTRNTENNLRLSNFEFDGITTTTELVHAHFQVRDFEWRDFEEIQLQPNPAQQVAPSEINNPSVPGPEGTVSQTYSSGVLLNLHGIAMHPRSGKTWSADGTP